MEEEAKDRAENGGAEAQSRLVIEAVRRTGTGKGYARKLRRADKIPGIVLDRGQSTPVELNPKMLGKVWQSAGKKFILQLGDERRDAILKDVQIDVVRRNPLHVDIMYE